MVDNATWFALAVVLTVLAALWTVYAFRRRGLGSGVRGVGITLLPAALYLTGTLRLFGRVADAVADWATRLVFSPSVWTGVVVGGCGILLFVAGGMLKGRGAGSAGRVEKKKSRASSEELPQQSRQSLGGTKKQSAGTGGGDDMADIEDILRKHGIN